MAKKSWGTSQILPRARAVLKDLTMDECGFWQSELVMEFSSSLS
jgi:hypothetical protein